MRDLRRVRNDPTRKRRADHHRFDGGLRHRHRGVYDRPAKTPSTLTFPDWWNWDLSFTSHAELRMEQRGVTEVEVRAMLENATGSSPTSWRADS